MGIVLATHGTKIPRIDIHLGMRLAAARNEAGMTQEQVATMLGVNRRTVVRWENNETPAPLASIISYSVITDVNLG